VPAFYMLLAADHHAERSSEGALEPQPE
jgi:hypothetical protein